MLEFGDDSRECLASGEDAAIIHIKGEVRVTGAFETELEEGRSKNRRKDGRERRTLRGAAKGSEGLRGKGVKMKIDRTIGKKTEYPSAGGRINSQRSEGGDHDPGLDMIEEMREVEEEYASDAIGGNAIPSFKPEESGCIRGRKEFMGPKLARA